MNSKTVEKPWGHYTQYTLNEPTTIKTLHIKGGERLSLQSHEHRAEHWIVIKGNAAVEINGVISLVSEGHDCYIKRGQKHRVGSFKGNVTILEISYGRFNENDTMTNITGK